jgi:hypothetical protein
MASAQRIYVVNGNGRQTLVRASSQAQALRHVAGSLFEVNVASADDVVTMMENGAVVQKANPEPEQFEIQE